MAKIAIYGAGAFGKIFFQSLEGKVDCFIDDFRSLELLFSVPILKLSQVSKDTLIYISILQHSKKIEKELQESGFSNIVNFTNSILQIPNVLEEIAKTDYLWLRTDKAKMIDDEKLEEFYNLLYDERSKTILNQIINLRKTFDVQYYTKPSDIEYFPSDVPILENIKTLHFIDCGGYTGDSIEELMKHHKNVATSLSFEPDNKNIKQLGEQLEILNNQFPNTQFFLYPAGVYSSNTILRFSNNGIDSSATIVESSDITIPVVSLDTIVLNSSPNYIKMDIEGAEKEALIGATKTIQKHKPNLAICLYHKPEDLWELPLLIHTIEPSYQMYLRVHEDLGLSTVLYCISKERLDV